ncbi:symplekin [Sporothrix brasiliensis 5110]|uniref:Symplekin n=1 Tax=Sporothrix brasiliensis 5110 TaxID=1398154 RepID=A0A0C2IMT1_9PEZI|nr:symplekin [Sporothrix brasiliensis 5110]KIH86297.1 symplekin [Sporothrix brasiliensis 5110]
MATSTDTAPSNGAPTGASTSTGSDYIQEQIRQLDDARKLALANVSHYPMIVQGILPIINPSSLPQLRRWGADFLAEAFAAPAMPSREKESLSLLVLGSIKGMLENPNEGPLVLRSIIQAASSIYPLVMRWVINNSYDTDTWERISAIKSHILRLWESPSPSIQICCIKFAQRVVLAQTHGANLDQRQRDGLEISLFLVPANHPLLDPRHLEAEATGLLDRMLGVLQDNSSDALIVDATLNTLSILVRTRPTTANRAINAILNFNPLKLASSSMTPRIRVMVKSMEKTTRMLLIHLMKRDPTNAFNPRIQQYVERLMRSRAELLDDAGRKRALADQQAAGDAKRQRVASGAAASLPQEIPALAPGPLSLADIFALTSNPQLRSFNASNVPLELAAKISVSTLARVDPQLLSLAITGIRDRLTLLETSATGLAMNPDTAPLDVEDDDDDYEPDFTAAEDAEQILNKLDNEITDRDVARVDAASLALGAFKLPAAPTLSSDQTVKVGQTTVARVFDMMQASEETAAAPSTAVGARKSGKAGLNRVAATSYDKEAWITILTRLATRSVSGLEDSTNDEENPATEEAEDQGPEDKSKKLVKKEGTNGASPALSKPGPGPVLSDKVRELLFRYVLEDFRKRIDVAVAWLCEEWYNDRLQSQYREGEASENDQDRNGQDDGHYSTWVVKVLDGFLPYLHSQDNKVLTRFLSEVPALNEALLQRIKSLCRDPSMVPVALTSLLYQVMMRPPARDLTLDTLQEIWIEFEDARPMATKFLDKWRPGFVRDHSAPAVAAVSAEAPPEGPPANTSDGTPTAAPAPAVEAAS